MTDARQILAVLANPATRRALARLELGAALSDALMDASPSRQRHIRNRLHAAGVIDEVGGYVPEAFGDALAAQPRAERPTGVHRFLTPDGRIDRYPRAVAGRVALLRLVAVDTVSPGETVTEPARSVDGRCGGPPAVAAR